MALLTGTAIAAAAAKAIIGAIAAYGAGKILESTDWKDFFNKAGDYLKDRYTFGNHKLPVDSEGYNKTIENEKLPNTDEIIEGNKDQTGTPPNNLNGNIEINPNNNQLGIIDGTGENESQAINGTSTYEFFQKYLEDERLYRIQQQKHLEERQDSAYQRAVADMRKAGINPNLIGSITPADSDAGITTSMNASSSELLTQMQTYSDELMKLIEQNWKGDENSMDRVTNLLGQWGQTLLFAYLTGSKKGG